MRILRLLGVAFILASPIYAPAQSNAQVAYPPGVTPDQLNAAIIAGTPPGCPAPPLDTLNGTAGLQPLCMDRPDRAPPAAVQSGTIATDSSGNISVTFARPMLSSAPSINLVPQNSGGTNLPIVCNWLTRSATGFTAGCWQAQTTTLGGTLTAILGTVISPFKAGSAGTAVTWFAREPTQ